MELRHLRYFVAAAEMENVSRAALKLHVSQPTLSTQIRDLEDELGFMLFERTGKSVRLTDMGFLLRSFTVSFFHYAPSDGRLLAFGNPHSRRRDVPSLTSLGW